MGSSCFVGYQPVMISYDLSKTVDKCSLECRTGQISYNGTVLEYGLYELYADGSLTPYLYAAAKYRPAY